MTLVDTGIEQLIRDQDERYIAWNLACMVPYRDAPQPAPAEPGRKPPPPIASNVAREGFKATNKVCEVITAAIRNRQEFVTLIDQQSPRQRRLRRDSKGTDPFARDVLGMAVRRWGPSWRSQMVFAMLCDIANEPSAAECKLRAS